MSGTTSLASPARISCSSSSSSMSSSAQLRKIKKPLIERKRRERINICLNQLKSLVLEAMNKNESCYSKMEKADILEMTVAHLKSMHHHHLACARGSQSSPTASATRYASGYRECASEVRKYLSAIDLTDKLEAGVRSSLIRYLGSRLEEVEKSIEENLNSAKLYPPQFPFQHTSANGDAEGLALEEAHFQFRGTPPALKTAERGSSCSSNSPTPHGILVCNSLITNPIDNAARILYRLQQPVLSPNEETKNGINSKAVSRSISVDHQEHLNRLLAAVPSTQLTLTKLPVSVGLACFSTSVGSLSCAASSAGSMSRLQMKSPTQGDEFPQAASNFTSSVANFPDSKVISASQSVEPVAMSYGDVWRPW